MLLALLQNSDDKKNLHRKSSLISYIIQFLFYADTIEFIEKFHRI